MGAMHPVMGAVKRVTSMRREPLSSHGGGGGGGGRNGGGGGFDDVGYGGGGGGGPSGSGGNPLAAMHPKRIGNAIRYVRGGRGFDMFGGSLARPFRRYGVWGRTWRYIRAGQELPGR